MRWIHTRAKRALVVFFALILYGALLFASAEYTFQYSKNSASLLLWGSFGFSAFTGLIFLAVGSLVWIYVKERRVALVLFGLSLTMMSAIVIKDAADLEANGLGIFTVLSNFSSFYALAFFSWLLLLFPKNYLAISKTKTEQPSSKISASRTKIWLQAYIVLTFIAATEMASYLLYVFLTGKNAAPLFNPIVLLYVAINLVGALITIGITYMRSISLREQQQLRLFTGGVILPIPPFLFLTIIPEALNIPFFIDSNIRTLTFIVFPLSLGYSILRYQVLVFDSYVRTAVAWIVGIIYLAVLSYVVVALCSMFTTGQPTFYVVLVATITAFCAPAVWGLARLMTEYLFFNELFHYRRLLNTPSALNNSSLDLEEAARLLTLAAIRTFETQEVCLFVLNEESGQYTLYPSTRDDIKEAARQQLLTRITTNLSFNSSVENALQNTIDANHPLLAQMQASSRPLLLGELRNASITHTAPSSAISRYLNTHMEDDYGNTLITPVRVQGKMIGLLVLGKRGNQEQYAGPDFEIAQLLLDRYSTVLETARLYRQANLSAELQNSLYHASMFPNTIFQTIEELALTYAHTAAQAVNGNAEIWMYDQKKKLLLRTDTPETRIPFLQEDSIQPGNSDWQTYFYSVSRREESQVVATTTPNTPTVYPA